MEDLQPRRRCRIPLRIELLAVLIPLMVISMAVAMWGLSNFLGDFFQRRAESETARLGRMVELALRQSMLREPKLALGATLADIEQTPSIRRVWVIDTTGRIAHASDRAVIGRVLNRTEDPACKACHAGGVAPAVRTIFTRDEAGAPILRHVRPIANEKACWQCHDPKARLNGMLLLEESTQPFQAALLTVQRRLGATGGITLIFLAGITLLVTTVLVQRPVSRLIAGVRQLGTGDLTVRVPVRGRNELAELASSFNGMAEDLDNSIKEIRNKNAELSVVYSILERITKTIDIGSLKEIIVQILIDVFDADEVILLSNLTPQDMREILIKSRHETRLYRTSYTEVLPESFPSALAGRWAEGGLYFPFVDEDGKTSVIPVGFGETSLGLLLIKRERPFTHAEANPKLLRALANHIGVAFENARLYTLAITDELTGLYNKRHFQQRIGEAVALHEQRGKQFGLVLLDLDHFKQINDHFGHPAGDKVLRHAARVMLRSIRVGDSAYRHGGEEFAILLPDANSVTTRSVAERIRQGIAALNIELDGERETGVTVSVGIAAIPEQGVSAEEIVAAADAALYRSKHEGRNRTTGAA